MLKRQVIITLRYSRFWVDACLVPVDEDKAVTIVGVAFKQNVVLGNVSMVKPCPHAQCSGSSPEISKHSVELATLPSHRSLNPSATIRHQQTIAHATRDREHWICSQEIFILDKPCACREISQDHPEIPVGSHGHYLDIVCWLFRIMPFLPTYLVTSEMFRSIQIQKTFHVLLLVRSGVESLKYAQAFARYWFLSLSVAFWIPPERES